MIKFHLLHRKLSLATGCGMHPGCFLKLPSRNTVEFSSVKSQAGYPQLQLCPTANAAGKVGLWFETGLSLGPGNSNYRFESKFKDVLLGMGSIA